jgi:hypothetical protein
MTLSSSAPCGRATSTRGYDTDLYGDGHGLTCKRVQETRFAHISLFLC